MARIPQHEIERLKSEVSLERLAASAGIELKRHGADLLGLCPWHNDREPSLVISPKKNLWHCLGACQAGGSVIDWVMKMNGVSFRHAVELLKEGLPALAAEPLKRASVRVLPTPVAIDADDQALLNQVIDYYHATLKASPEALAYLERRGLVHLELVDRFKLGFANRTLGLRLPEKNRKDGAQIRERLTKLGLYRESGHEHFNGCLVIPVIDEQGNVTEVYGRKIGERLKPGIPLHLYLPGPHRGLWNFEALQASKEVILCEALIDAMSFWCAGYRNVTASYGVEGFTEDHLAAFKRYGTERVLIAYDRDQAGDGAAEKLAERLMGEGIECWRIQFPKGMDANEYALKLTPATKSVGLAIRKALWLGKGSVPSHVPEAQATPDVAILASDTLTESALVSSVETVLSLAAKAETLPELSASPVAPAPTTPEICAEVKESEVLLSFGDRHYRIRGLQKNLSYEVLKVNVLAARDEAFYVDTLDLYAARQRVSYIAQAALELKLGEEIIKSDLGKVLLKLEGLQEEQIRKTLEPKPIEHPTMSADERAAGLELLRDPKLLDRILGDFEACGIVGERTNKLVGFLAAVSRKLDAPLAVVIQSASAAGKSALMDAVLAMMPEEERVKYSAMTGQSLFYMGQTNLKHKILAIVEEEGASRASYALKLLQSEGELTIASTGKDPTTGNLVTQEYRVEGPVMIFLTTTAIEIDEELLNRCLVLSVDEGRAQTQAIHRLQREKRTLEGLIARTRKAELLAVHRNAQRLLKFLAVLNPYARNLTFPDEATRTRRDHEKYLTLIDTIALLHQHQREVRTLNRGGQLIEYVEVTLDDIAIANQLAHEVLGRSLDELPPQTRRLLMLIDEHVRAQCEQRSIARSAYRFSRRELREAIGWGDTQLKVHLARLVEMEYLTTHRDGNGFLYELVYDGAGKDGELFVPGLIDVTQLRYGYDSERSGSNTDWSGAGRPAVGPRSGIGRTPASTANAQATGDCEPLLETTRQTHISSAIERDSSYAQTPVVPLAAASR